MQPLENKVFHATIKNLEKLSALSETYVSCFGIEVMKNDK